MRIMTTKSKFSKCKDDSSIDDEDFEKEELENVNDDDKIAMID